MATAEHIPLKPSCICPGHIIHFQFILIQASDHLTYLHCSLCFDLLGIWNVWPGDSQPSDPSQQRERNAAWRGQCKILANNSLFAVWNVGHAASHRLCAGGRSGGEWDVGLVIVRYPAYPCELTLRISNQLGMYSVPFNHPQQLQMGLSRPTTLLQGSMVKECCCPGWGGSG